MQAKDVRVVQFALAIVRNSKKQFLSVMETDNRGWWVPGGRVEPGETCHIAAVRECKEEAGIDIALKGVLRIETSVSQCLRQRIIYYAEPIDEKQPPKSVADEQSLFAKYLTLEQIHAQKKHWRGPELYEWALYLSQGGAIYPMEVLEE